MKYQSKVLLDNLFTQTEILLNKAISEWQLQPAEFFTAQPGPGKWSAAQCLEHLNSYGRYYLPAIEKAIGREKEELYYTHFKSGRLGNYCYKLMLTDLSGNPTKKMNAPKEHRPAGQLNSTQVLSEFISQQEQLQQLLILSRKKNLNSIRIPISIASFIKLKLGDVLLFYTAHINRHISQAERAMKAAGYQPEKTVPVYRPANRVMA